MSYQVLARKWRPHSFAEMAGQEHVLRALINALDQQRLHQAYLFTGTRGVGKTTIARIIAKALNCERGISSTPCGECSACVEIAEGRFIDLIEVDAASRTKVEDTRELLDNVQYTPTRGRYKVYLIDEVHMLSTHSFNALLKTLEEPPPHVKFLLATTDPQKLPATILSRCLQFNLKRMSPDLIESQLIKILKEEAVEHDASSLKYLSHAADGSMRDALSLLDQAIAYGQGSLRSEDVANMLGYISREPIYELLAALIAQDAEAMIGAVAALEEQAADYLVVLDELISLLQQLALAQWAPAAVDDSFGDSERVCSLAKQLSVEDVQLYYQIALVGKRDLPLSPVAKQGLEMVLLRMLAFQPAASAGNGDANGGAAATKPRPAADSHNKTPTNGSPQQAQVSTAEPAATQSSVATQSPGADNRVSSAEVARQSLAEARQAVKGMLSEKKTPESSVKPATSVPPPAAQPAVNPPPPVTQGQSSVPVQPSVQPPAQSPTQSSAQPPAQSQPAIQSAAPAMEEEPPPLMSEHVPSITPSNIASPSATAAESTALSQAPTSTQPTAGNQAPTSTQPTASNAAQAGNPTAVSHAPTSNPAPASTPTAVAEPPEVVSPAAKLAAGSRPARWRDLYAVLGLKGMLAELAANCEIKAWQDNHLVLLLTEQHAQLYNKSFEQRLTEAVSQCLSEQIKVSIEIGEAAFETPAKEAARIQDERQQAAVDAIEQDQIVKVLAERFDAEIQLDSVKPVVS